MRIEFNYDALNVLYICAEDIRNTYLKSSSLQKDYILCGAEFGKYNVVKKALIGGSLFGGKSVGRYLRNHLHDCMRKWYFVSCPTDPDV